MHRRRRKMGQRRRPAALGLERARAVSFCSVRMMMGVQRLLALMLFAEGCAADLVFSAGLTSDANVLIEFMRVQAQQYRFQ